MRMKTHLNLRIALTFVGFFGGFGLFILLHSAAGSNFGLTAALFFASTFGGAFLTQFVFSRLFPATCPRCGAAGALAGARNPFLYICRDCGAECNIGMVMANETAIENFAASAARRSYRTETEKVMWLMLVVGVAMLGGATYFVVDSVRFVRDGVTANATVSKVNVHEDRHREKPETIYTAIITYEVGNKQYAIDRSWSVDARSSCIWPCYSQGESVKVLYLPSDPSDAKIRSVAELFLGQVLVGLIGLMFIVVSVWVLRSSRRRLDL